MEKVKVLISGASIAGPTLAFWLARYGFEVTIVERAETLRLGGQNIDVKGPAKQVIERMGLEPRVRAANTTEKGIRFVDERNRLLAEFAKEDALSMTQELEILRGDLVEILYDATKEQVTYKFGNHITAVQKEAGGTSVSFASGNVEQYGLVIVAEGIGAPTREMVMPGETHFKFLGLYTAYFTATKVATDSEWARWHNAPGGIVFLLRPDNNGTTRVCINFRSPEQGYEKLTEKEKKDLLSNRIKGTGWESDRLLVAISESDDFYLERLSQVKMPRWSNGRSCLLGDAAYCVTPIGGGGTDLAITGAYILAGELHTAGTFGEAFRNYEQKLRPLVNKIQKVPPGVPGLVYPTSKTGVQLLNTAFRIAGSQFFKSVAGAFSKEKMGTGAFVLPKY
jgi:2-polyprenyl-6-methoxyphenol hydroxylase-like FAD-dependent oxidoreductase